MPQRPPHPPTPSGAPQDASASRGDELLPGVGQTMYEFQGKSAQSMGSQDLGMAMERPHRSNLSSGRGGMMWIGAAVLLGAGAVFWLINGNSSAQAPESKDPAVAGAPTQAPVNNDTAPAKKEEAATTPSKAEQEAAAKKQAEQEAAAAKKKAEQEAAAAKKKAEAEAAAKKKAEADAAAKKKAEQEAAAKKKVTPKKKSTPKKSSTKKKSSKVKRIKPRPKNSGLDGLPDPD